MNYQVTSRTQRPKGFKVKQALQFALLFAVCFWLLYRINYSHKERQHYGGSTTRKLSKEQGAVNLGRKGHAEWSNQRGDSDLDSDSQHVNPSEENEKKEVGGGGDEDLDRKPEEKAKGESNEQREHEKEPEKEYVESQVHEDSNLDFGLRGEEVVSSDKEMYNGDIKGLELRGSILDHDEQASNKEIEKVVKEPENKEGKDAIKMESSGGMVNSSISGKGGMVNEVVSFHDENGIPQDVEDESIWTESSDDQRSSLHQAYKESKGTLEKSKAAIDTHSSGASTINQASEIVQEKSKDSEVSHSVSS